LQEKPLGQPLPVEHMVAVALIEVHDCASTVHTSSATSSATSSNSFMATKKKKKKLWIIMEKKKKNRFKDIRISM
jgi:hypothetical protein